MMENKSPAISYIMFEDLLTSQLIKSNYNYKNKKYKNVHLSNKNFLVFHDVLVHESCCPYSDLKRRGRIVRNFPSTTFRPVSICKILVWEVWGNLRGTI